MTQTAFQAGGDAIAADLDMNIASINLTHLLARLEQNLLSPSSSSADLKQLRQSRYHRARVGANIDYAHSLLVQLERSLPKIKSPERRHARQTDLARKRTALKQVKERLEMITEEVEGIVRPRGADEEEEEEVLSEEDDGEDFLLDTKSTPARLSSTGEKEGEEVNEKETIDGEEEEGQESLRRAETETQTEKEAEAEAEAGAPSTTSTSTLRHRHRHPQTSAITATSTPTTFTSTTTALPTIPSTTAAAAAATTQTKTQLTESTLTAHRLEQESLTESLVALASQLKASSQAFQSSLEAEKSILARAVDGLDRNVAGLEAAGKRMGVLRRMTEGKGWWGRMLMYVWIFVLWLVALGIVFLGPKVRF